MKKQESPVRPPKMRKRTQDEQTQMNRQRTAAEREKLLGWSDINALHATCQNKFMLVAPAITVIRNRKILEAVGEGHISGLRRSAEVLLRDVEMLKGQLKEIHDKHAGRKGGQDDPTLIIHALQLGEEYQQWLYRFDTLVLPVVQDILATVHDNLNDDSNQAAA